MSPSPSKETLAAAVAAYIKCALWSTTASLPEDPEANNPPPLDSWASSDDIDPATLDTMRQECTVFLKAHAAQIDAAALRTERDRFTHAACEFWLTRNRHGAGFWDTRELWQGYATDLAAAAHATGERNLYVGDDRFIYQYPTP